MSFEEEILSYENRESGNYLIYLGSSGVLLSAPHTMEQIKDEGVIKPQEPFTKGIAMYVASHTDSSYLIKIKDNGVDANRSNDTLYKDVMVDLVNKNNIKLIFDIHGAKKEREFDVELGTLNNLSADYSTIKELEEAFTENGISVVERNTLFKGGDITKNAYFRTDVDVIQIEINGKYRDYKHLDMTKMICDSLIKFINQYIK